MDARMDARMGQEAFGIAIPGRERESVSRKISHGVVVYKMHRSSTEENGDGSSREVGSSSTSSTMLP